MQEILAPLAPANGPMPPVASEPPTWHALVEPACSFRHPRDVLARPDLSVSEKRAILASWASDACAVESAPALRQPPEAGEAVSVDDVLDALRALDGQATEGSGEPIRLRPKPPGGLRRLLSRIPRRPCRARLH